MLPGGAVYSATTAVLVQVDPAVTCTPFRTFQELHDSVKAFTESGVFDFILMPAAISDYAPVPPLMAYRGSISHS